VGKANENKGFSGTETSQFFPIFGDVNKR